jgi:hypothetical protein
METVKPISSAPKDGRLVSLAQQLGNWWSIAEAPRARLIARRGI